MNIYCNNCKHYLDTCLGQHEDIFEFPSCYDEYVEEYEDEEEE